MRDVTIRSLAVALALVLAAGPWLPQWALSLLTISLGKGLVVLGLLLLMRTGLVSFGQGLYYCLGAYAAGVLAQWTGLYDAVAMLVFSAIVSVLVASVLGLLLASYRGIFFAMLSLAFSMILYGLLIKMPAFGSSDGFNVVARTMLGIELAGKGGYAVLALAAVSACAAAMALHRYLGSHLGSLAPAIRDNELRVEYMGASVRGAVHLNYAIAALLAGMGGGVTALSVGHIDPEMAYWTTSGEFVFVAILSGTGSVAAPLAGSILFEWLRSYAYQYSPNTWQMVLGAAMLLIIMFLPAGLWSVLARRNKGA